MSSEKKEMLKWLKMWDRPMSELHGHKILDADDDPEGIIERLFDRLVTESTAE